MWARFSFSRERRSAARLRARASPSSPSARLTVSLPDWRRSSRPRAGRAGSGRRGAGVAWPWRGPRALLLVRRRRAPAGRARAPARRRGALPPRRRRARPRRLFLGLAIFLGAALLVLGLRPWPGSPRGGAHPRAPASAALRPRASGAPERSCAVSALAGRGAGLGAGAGATGAGAGSGAATTGSGFGASASPGRPRMRRFFTSTTTVFERPWLKLCFTLPVSTVRLRPSGARVPSFGLSVVSLTQNPSFTIRSRSARHLRRRGA